MPMFRGFDTVRLESAARYTHHCDRTSIYTTKTLGHAINKVKAADILGGAIVSYVLLAECFS